MDIQIIPSILELTKEKFDLRYEAINPHVSVAQLDVLDGSFLPNINFHDPEYIDNLEPQMKFEVHFMINNVAEILDQWNYQWVEKVIFHIEANDDPVSLIYKIKAMGKKAGAAINPETPTDQIKELVGQVDTALVMTVNPGINGAPFVPETIEKVKELRDLNSEVNIEVDGAMSPQTIKLAVDAGANLIVSGGFIKNNAVKESLEQLKKAIAR